jgi:predicted methyltransferase
MKTHILFALLFGVAATQASAASIPDYIAKAVADPTRPADDRKLDADRKPAEILTYANVRPGETVAEYLPGGGYYTRLLSDIVGPNGKIYALETTTWGKENSDSTKKAIDSLTIKNASLDLAPLGDFHLAAPVDLFWTSNNYHDLHIPKYATVDMLAFDKHVYESLKPGGVFLIIDHAAAPGTGATTSPKLHRIEKALVVKEVTAAGFKFAGESTILENPADDHSKPIFDPSIRWKTDQFILTFRKP